MDAIDFKKLMQEERRKLKKEKSNRIGTENRTKDSQRSHDQSHVVVDALTAKISASTLSQGKFDEFNASSYKNWDYPDGFLRLRELELQPICQNPRSISYSPTALDKQRRGNLKNSNGTESKVMYQSGDGTIDHSKAAPTPIAISPEAALTSWLQQIPSGDSGFGEWKKMSYGRRRVCVFGEETGGSLPSPLAEISRQLVERSVFPSSSLPNHVLLNEYQPGQGILPHTDGPLYDDRTATLSLGSDVVIEFTKRLASNEIGATTTTAKKNTTSQSDTLNGNNMNSGSENGCDSNTSIASLKNAQCVPSSGPIQVLLESGSLLVFQGDAYINYCHGIEVGVWQDTITDNCLNAHPSRIVPRELRYSLTFRHKKS